MDSPTTSRRNSLTHVPSMHRPDPPASRASTSSQSTSQTPLLQPDAPMRPATPDANLGRPSGLQAPRDGAGQPTAAGASSRPASLIDGQQPRPTQRLQKPAAVTETTPPVPAAKTFDQPLLRMAALWRASKPVRRVLLKAAVVTASVSLCAALIAVGSMSGFGLVLALAVFMSPVGYLAWDAVNKAHKGAVARQARRQQLAQEEPQMPAVNGNQTSTNTPDTDSL
jgi:hypothetical protein